MLFIWILSNLSLIFDASAMSKEKKDHHMPSNISLFVGESRVVDLRGESDMTLSKKNTVSARYLRNGQWLITGIRPGVVLIEPNSPNGEIIVVTVQTQPKYKRHQIFDPGGKFHFICQERNITCRRRLNRISGILSSWQRLYEFSSICKKEKDCINDLKLSTLGKKHLTDFLNRTMPECLAKPVGDHGKFTVSCPCNKNKGQWKERIDFLALGAVSKGNIYMSCLPQLKKSYIFSLIFLSSSRSISDDMELREFLFSHQPLLLSDLSFNLERKKNSFKVIGQPHMRLESGVQARLMAGLGIPGDGSVSSSISKPAFSLSASVQVAPIDRAYAEGKLKIVLFPKRQSFTRESKVLLESTVRLKVGETSFIGEFDSNLSRKNHKTVPFFGEIPIIAPIINSRKTDSAASKVHIGVRLDNDIGQDLRNLHRQDFPMNEHER